MTKPPIPVSAERPFGSDDTNMSTEVSSVFGLDEGLRWLLFTSEFPYSVLPS